MASHHFVGKGLHSEELSTAIQNPSELDFRITDLVEGADLRIVDRRVAEFDGGGLTFVWILAESHLVLHYWRDEGYVTIDLHVCEYRQSNADRAAVLVEGLTAFCFRSGSGTWQELHLEDPVALAAELA